MRILRTWGPHSSSILRSSGGHSPRPGILSARVRCRPADVPTQKKPKAEEKLSLAQAAIIAGVSDVGVLSIRHIYG